jgi:hypothetical protein
MPEHADELDDGTGSSFVALSRANSFQCPQQRGAQPTVARTARSHAEVVAAKQQQQQQQQQQSRGADFFRDSLAKRRKMVSFSQSSQDDSTDEDEEDEEQDGGGSSSEEEFCPPFSQLVYSQQTLSQDQAAMMVMPSQQQSDIEEEDEDEDEDSDDQEHDGDDQQEQQQQQQRPRHGRHNSRVADRAASVSGQRPTTAWTKHYRGSTSTHAVHGTGCRPWSGRRCSFMRQQWARGGRAGTVHCRRAPHVAERPPARRPMPS